MAKYHSEKEFFTDRTAIYDEHGRKVGYSEKSLFGDHVNIYDANGKKIGQQEQSLFGDHINVYDANGKKVGEQHKAFFGDHTNIYDSNGKKIGESHPSMWTSGTDTYVRDSDSTSSMNQGAPLGVAPRSNARPIPVNLHEKLSHEETSMVSLQERIQAERTGHELTREETVAFARLCADLLEKAGVQTYGTIFTKEEYKKKVRYGFLNLKSYEKTERKYVPGEAYWLLNRIVENEERTGYRYEMQFIYALTKSGKLYHGDVREAYYPNGTYVLNKNEWRDYTAFNLISSLVPFLDLLLKRNKINMSSGLYWLQLHPQAAAPKAPAPSKPAPIQQKAQTPAPSKPTPAQQKAQTPAPSKPTPSQQPLSTEEQIKQKMAEINLYSIREAIFAMESLGGDFVDFMAGKITLTKTKDNYITYDELLAELRKLYGDRNSK